MRRILCLAGATFSRARPRVRRRRCRRAGGSEFAGRGLHDASIFQHPARGRPGRLAPNSPPTPITPLTHSVLGRTDQEFSVSKAALEARTSLPHDRIVVNENKKCDEDACEIEEFPDAPHRISPLGRGAAEHVAADRGDHPLDENDRNDTKELHESTGVRPVEL